MLLQNCGMNNLPQKVQSLKNHVSDLSPEHGLRPEGRVDHPTPFSHPHPCLGSEIIKIHHVHQYLINSDPRQV